MSFIETGPVLSDMLRPKGTRVASALDPVPDGSLSGIHSLNVLEHIEDDDTALALWHRKLAPGGRLLVYVPAFQVLFSSMDRKVSHRRRYRKAGLTDQMKRAGFSLDTVRYANSLGFLVALQNRFIDSGPGDINPRMLQIYGRWVFPVSRLLDLLCGPLFRKNVCACAINQTLTL